jgi:hypothetical protein
VTTPVSEERAALVQEIFRITGDKVDPNDPMVTAALFCSKSLLAASEKAASTLSAAAEGVVQGIRAVELQAKASNKRVDRQLRSLEHRMATIDGLPAKAPPVARWETWHLGAAFLAGVAAVSFVVLVFASAAITYSEDAAVGRGLVRVLPSLDKETREKLLDHMRRQSAKPGQ